MTHSDNGTKTFQARTTMDTTATPNRKSSAKKDGNRMAALMMPPVLSRNHGSSKRKNAERKLKLPPAKVIQRIRKAEIAKQASKLYVSKPRDGCCFRSVVPSS